MEIRKMEGRRSYFDSAAWEARLGAGMRMKKMKMNGKIIGIVACLLLLGGVVAVMVQHYPSPQVEVASEVQQELTIAVV